MKFNYQTEKNKLDRAWVKLESDYRSAGMTEAAIEEMRAFDYEQFRNERTYCNHNDYFDFSVVDADVEEGNAETLMLSKHIEAFSTEMNLMESDDRYAWIDLLDNQELCGEIKKLKIEDIELLTLFAIEGYTVVEIAKLQGVTHGNVSQKISRIKKYLKNFKIV